MADPVIRDLQAHWFGSECEKNQRVSVVFVVDSSGSVLQSGWNTQMHFVNNLGQLFEQIAPNTRFSLVSFAESAEVLIPRTKQSLGVPFVDLAKELPSLPYRNGKSTDIYSALSTAWNIVLLTTADDSKRVCYVVLLTDGFQNSTPNDPGTVAGLLKNKATVICVGIGEKAEFTTMKNWCTTPSHMVVSTFSNLHVKLVEHLVPFDVKQVHVTVTLPSTFSVPVTSSTEVKLEVRIICGNVPIKKGKFVLSHSKHYRMDPQTIDVSVDVDNNQTITPTLIPLSPTTKIDTEDIISFTLYSVDTVTREMLNVNVNFCTQFFAGDFNSDKPIQILLVGPPGSGKTSFAIGCVTSVSTGHQPQKMKAASASRTHVTTTFAPVSAISSAVTNFFPFRFWDIWGISNENIGGHDASPYKLVPLRYFIQGRMPPHVQASELKDYSTKLDSLAVNPSMVMDCVIVFLPYAFLSVDFEDESVNGKWKIFFESLETELSDVPAFYVLSWIDEDPEFNCPNWSAEKLEKMSKAKFLFSPFYPHQNYSQQKTRSGLIDWSTRRIMLDILNMGKSRKSFCDSLAVTREISRHFASDISCVTVDPSLTLCEFVLAQCVWYDDKKTFIKRVNTHGACFLMKTVDGWVLPEEDDWDLNASLYFTRKRIIGFKIVTQNDNSLTSKPHTLKLKENTWDIEF